MSIAKARSISHLKACLSYAMNKAGAKEICRQNLAGENIEELYAEFKVVQGLNDRCANNTIRIEISPTVADGQHLTKSDWESIIRLFAQRMNFSDRPYIGILHTDRAHKHVHILCSRIDFLGVAYNDSNISRKAGKIMEQIALVRGMTTAMSVRAEQQRKLQPAKDRILAAHRAVARQGLTPLKYQALMREERIEVVFNKSKTTGRITGMSYLVCEIKLKASEVDRRLGYNMLFGVKLEAAKPVQQTPRQRLIRSRPTAAPFVAPTSSIGMQVAQMFGHGVVQYAKPDEKEKEEEQNLTL